MMILNSFLINVYLYQITHFFWYNLLQWNCDIIRPLLCSEQGLFIGKLHIDHIILVYIKTLLKLGVIMSHQSISEFHCNKEFFTWHVACI